MNTEIKIIATGKTIKWCKRERFTVYPDTIHLYNPETFIILFYIRWSDSYVTIPGTTFDDIRNEWSGQFAIAKS